MEDRNRLPYTYYQIYQEQTIDNFSKMNWSLFSIALLFTLKSLYKMIKLDIYVKNKNIQSIEDLNNFKEDKT